MEQLGQPSPSLHMTRRFVEGRFDGFDIVHTGRIRCKSFSHAWVDQGVIEGWAALAERTLTLRTYPEPLVFTLLQINIGDRYVGVLDADVHERYQRKPGV